MHEIAIRAARAAYNAAISPILVGEFVAACLADDYRLQASNGTTVQGRDALLAHWREKFAHDPDVCFVRRPAAIAVDGGSARERGSWTGHLTDRGVRVERAGSYEAEWRLEDDRWLLVAETFSAR